MKGANLRSKLTAPFWSLARDTLKLLYNLAAYHWRFANYWAILLPETPHHHGGKGQEPDKGRRAC
jgi:hypothetical protein